jgi:hypothetical protein
MHRGFEIIVTRVSGKNKDFSIRGEVNYNGFTDEPGSCRKLALQIAAWLDAELREIEALL